MGFSMEENPELNDGQSVPLRSLTLPRFSRYGGSRKDSSMRRFRGSGSVASSSNVSDTSSTGTMPTDVRSSDGTTFQSTGPARSLCGKNQLRLLETLGEENVDGVQIICVGVMRTGLKTLHKALRNLGLSNISDQEDIVNSYEHWDKVLHNKADIKPTCKDLFKDCEVVMGMPIFCFWEEICEMYPNARVILTVRDEDDWWRSVKNAEAQMHKDMPGAPLRYGSMMRRFEQFLMPSYHKFCEVLRFAWATTLGAHALQGGQLNETIARSSFRKHNTYVKALLGRQVATRGGPRLLVYDVSQGWGPLCKFFGRDIPEVEFPLETMVPYFPGQQAVPSVGGSLEDMLMPQSEFGVRMRREMRMGLIRGAGIMTVLVTAVLAVLFTQSVQIPVAFIAMGYLVIFAAICNVYLVLDRLVLKVPALVILPMAMKSVFIAGALQVCLITYGILKEMLVTHDRVASPLLVLSSRLGAIVCATVAMLIVDGHVSLGVPISSMAAFALTNETSTWAGYEMLKYVSFPIQVMAKSVKMLPMMVMGRVVNGTRYTTQEYVKAFVALVSVAIMGFSSDSGGTISKINFTSKETLYNFAMGTFLLLLFFATDSFTSQWQDKLYKQHAQLTQTQMMLGGNLLGFLITAATSLTASWTQVHASFVSAAQNPSVTGRIMCLGVVYACSQFCIYSAIRILGPLSFTWLMTARQLLSVLISLVFFGHGLNMTKVLCILVVFGIMSSKNIEKALPKLAANAQRIRRSIRDRFGNSHAGVEKIL